MYYFKKENASNSYQTYYWKCIWGLCYVIICILFISSEDENRKYAKKNGSQKQDGRSREKKTAKKDGRNGQQNEAFGEFGGDESSEFDQPQNNGYPEERKC